MVALSKEYSPLNKYPGQLEQWHATEVQPLPPTPILPTAERVFKKWGLPAFLLTELQEIIRQFRYDLCPQKVDRLVEHPAFWEVTEPDKGRVWFPHFFDGQGRGDGQCVDLTYQSLLQLHFTGWLEDAQAYAARVGKRIDVFTAVGNSEQHFTTPNSHHVWGGIAEVDDYGRIKDSILIDVGYQLITKHHGYHQWGEVAIGNQIFQRSLHGNLELTVTRHFEHDRLLLHNTQTLILGLSHSRRFAYGLSLVYWLERNIFIPVIDQIHPNGEQVDSFLWHPDKPGVRVDFWTDQASYHQHRHAPELIEVDAMLKSFQWLEIQPLTPEIVAKYGPLEGGGGQRIKLA